MSENDRNSFWSSFPSVTLMSDLPIVLFKIAISLLFFVYSMSIYVYFSTVIITISIFPCNSVSFCFLYSAVMMLGT